MFGKTGWLIVLAWGCTFCVRGQDIPMDSVSTIDSTILAIDSTFSAFSTSDSIVSRSATAKGKPKFYPNPKTALRLSLLTPGLAGGQIYNRDYWKLPFVYAGYGASIYFVILNIGRYGTMVDHYKEFYHLSDRNAPNYGQRNNEVEYVTVYIKSQNRYVERNIDQIKRAKDTYRRWRDWSFFALGAVYTLAAIEANVAAHLKTFDLSDDLSMQIQPKLIQPQMTTPTPGIRLVLSIK